MDTNMDKYLGTYLDDRYEILEVIGTGGMAVVYKAMCHRLNRYVAVKILRDELANDAEFRQRFQTEAQAVAMLSHPNIVSVYDVSHSEGVEYIVMELIEGVTLMQYMKKKGALGWKEALHFAVQISKALEQMCIRDRYRASGGAGIQTAGAGNGRGACSAAGAQSRSGQGLPRHPQTLRG